MHLRKREAQPTAFGWEGSTPTRATERTESAHRPCSQCGKAGAEMLPRSSLIVTVELKKGGEDVQNSSLHRNVPTRQKREGWPQCTAA